MICQFSGTHLRDMHLFWGVSECEKLVTVWQVAKRPMNLGCAHCVRDPVFPLAHH